MQTYKHTDDAEGEGSEEEDPLVADFGANAAVAAYGEDVDNDDDKDDGDGGSVGGVAYDKNGCDDVSISYYLTQNYKYD